MGNSCHGPEIRLTTVDEVTKKDAHLLRVCARSFAHRCE